MKTKLKWWPWALAVTGAVAFAVSVPSTQAEGGGAVIIEERPATVVTYHYVYYPDVEVYFVPETKVYFWLEGSTWRSAPKPPPTIVLGTSVTLDLDKPEPWKYHKVIVEKYGGRHNKVKVKEKIKEKDKD